jgi:hypothetical protein
MHAKENDWQETILLSGNVWRDFREIHNPSFPRAIRLEPFCDLIVGKGYWFYSSMCNRVLACYERLMRRDAEGSLYGVHGKMSWVTDTIAAFSNIYDIVPQSFVERQVTTTFYGNEEVATLLLRQYLREFAVLETLTCWLKCCFFIRLTMAAADCQIIKRD